MPTFSSAEDPQRLRTQVHFESRRAGSSVNLLLEEVATRHKDKKVSSILAQTQAARRAAKQAARPKSWAQKKRQAWS